MKKWIKRHHILVGFSDEEQLMQVLHHTIPKIFPIFLKQSQNVTQDSLGNILSTSLQFKVSFNCTHVQWRQIQANIKYGLINSSAVIID